MTIHITPEAEFSYVSFETNAPQEDYISFTEKIINLFKPSKWMLNCAMPDIRSSINSGFSDAFHNIESGASLKEWALVNGVELYGELIAHQFGDFCCSDLQIAHYKHCDLVFARYVSEGIS